jgi:hypothetical protein
MQDKSIQNELKPNSISVLGLILPPTVIIVLKAQYYASKYTYHHNTS